MILRFHRSDTKVWYLGFGSWARWWRWPLQQCLKLSGCTSARSNWANSIQIRLYVHPCVHTYIYTYICVCHDIMVHHYIMLCWGILYSMILIHANRRSAMACIQDSKIQIWCQQVVPGSSWFVQDWTNCLCFFLISCHELRETLQIGVCHWRWDNLVVAELCGLIKRGLQLVWGRKAFAFRFGRWLCVPETWDSWQLILVFCPN